MNDEAPHHHPPSGDTLAELLRSAQACGPMTPRELWQQRVSFAYGNVALHNPAVTREMVEAEAARVYGPCPGDEATAAHVYGGPPRAHAVSIVDRPVEPNCKTSDGRWLAVDWREVGMEQSDAQPSAWSAEVPQEDGFWWYRAPGDGASVCRRVGANFYLVGEDLALRAEDFLPTTEFARAEEPR